MNTMQFATNELQLKNIIKAQKSHSSLLNVALLGFLLHKTCWLRDVDRDPLTAAVTRHDGQIQNRKSETLKSLVS